MSPHKILVIDDDLDMCTLLQRFLMRKGFEVVVANSGSAGLEALKEHAPGGFDGFQAWRYGGRGCSEKRAGPQSRFAGVCHDRLFRYSRGHRCHQTGRR